MIVIRFLPEFERQFHSGGSHTPYDAFCELSALALCTPAAGCIIIQKHVLAAQSMSEYFRCGGAWYYSISKLSNRIQIKIHIYAHVICISKIIVVSLFYVANFPFTTMPQIHFSRPKIKDTFHLKLWEYWVSKSVR